MPQAPSPESWNYDTDLSAIVIMREHRLLHIADFGKTELPPAEAEANAQLMVKAKAMKAVLLDVLYACLFAEGAGAIGVTTDPHIRSELFAKICEVVG